MGLKEFFGHKDTAKKWKKALGHTMLHMPSNLKYIRTLFFVQLKKKLSGAQGTDSLHYDETATFQE